MSKTVDELIGVYIEASNAVVWEAEKCGLCPMTLDMQRAGIAAVIRALRDECDRVLPCDRKFSRAQVWDVFNEILGEKAVTPGERQDTLCERCKEMIEPDDVAHIVEAFETTGKMLCAGCWGHYCEENEV